VTKRLTLRSNTAAQEIIAQTVLHKCFARVPMSLATCSKDRVATSIKSDWRVSLPTVFEGEAKNVKRTCSARNRMTLSVNGAVMLSVG